MNKNIKIDPIDEALRLIHLESSSNADNSFSALQLQNILEAEYSTQISASDKEAILNKLYKYASSQSFGDLIVEAMSKKAATSLSLAQELKISEAVVIDLKEDKVFTNNVPVVFVKNILQYLDISFQKAHAAILKTFELLKSQAVIEEVNFRSMQPAFRKSYYASREASAWSNNMAESRDLFENEEALKKYLVRLDELMNK
jgi:hypothetical protein